MEEEQEEQVEEKDEKEPVKEEKEAVAEESTKKEPVAEEPVVEEPVAEEPVIEEPVIEEPVQENIAVQNVMPEEQPIQLYSNANLGNNIYTPTTGSSFFLYTTNSNITVDDDGYMTISADNTDGDKTAYANFMTKPFADIKVGDRYWLNYELTDVDAKKGEEAVNNTSLFISSADNLDPEFEDRIVFSISDGETYSGKSFLTAVRSTDEATTGLRSFFCVPAGAKVSFKIKITLRKVEDTGNLYPYSFMIKGTGISVNDDLNIEMDCAYDSANSNVFHNFFASKGNIEDGEYYKVSYVLKPEEVVGTPTVYIKSTDNGGNISQLGNENDIIIRPTAGDTTPIEGSFVALGKDTTDVNGETKTSNNMLRSYVVTSGTNKVKGTMAIDVEKLTSYDITVDSDVTAKREDVRDANSAKAPEGQVVSYSFTAEGNVVPEVKDSENNNIPFTYKNGKLTFTMPASPVTIGVTVFQLSAVVDGYEIKPQAAGTDLYLFLPANADFSKLAMKGNVSISGTEKGFNLNLTDTAETINLAKLFTEEMKSGVAYDLKLNGNVTVKVMRADNISSLFITSDKTVAELNVNDKSNKGKGEVIMVGKDGNQINENIELAQIKGRGNTSWTSSGEKRPYNIKLGKKAELISGAGKATKWCLISDNCNGGWVHEAAGLANEAAYDMYEQIGGKDAMKHEFINLYINGEYRGVYMITEKVEIDKERIDITKSKYDVEDETSTTIIINKDRKVDPYPQYWSKDLADKATLAADDDPAIQAGIQAYQYATNAKASKMGGYLLELDRGFNSEASWFITSHGTPYVLKEPEFASKEQVQQIAIYVQQAEDALYADSGYNSEKKYYTDYYDIDSAAKKIIIDLASAQCDTYVTSCFFSVDVDGEGKLGKIYSGPAWDYDGSNFASQTPVESYYPEKYSSNNAACNPHIIYELYQHSEFADAMKKLSDGTLKTVWEAEKDKIASDITSITNSYEMNKILWPKGNSGAKEDFTDPNALNTFKTNFDNRYDVWYAGYTDSKLHGVDVAKSIDRITATSNATSYQWYKLNEDGIKLEIIDGATESVYKPSEDRTYYCAATGSAVNYLAAGQMTMYSAPVEFEVTRLTVKYDSNNGSDPTNETVKYGDEITVPEKPEKTGWTFTGWKSGETTYKPGDKIEVTDNITLVAQYVPNQTPVVPGNVVNYIVEYYKENLDGTYEKVEADSTRKGDKIGSTVTAEEKDYDHYVLNKEKSKLSGELVAIKSASDIVTLSVYYDLDEHTVAFDLKDGSEASVQTIKHGKTAEKPADPGRTGFRFLGWFSDENLTTEFDFSQAIEEDTTVYAGWKKKSSDGGDPSYTGGSSSSGVSSSSSSKNDVTADKETENGSIKLDKDSASKGSTVTITVTPDEGYETEKVTVIDKNGKEIEVKDNGNGTYTFTMPATGVDVKADFKEATGDSAEEEPTVITMQIGNNDVSVNEKKFTNDVAPVIRNDRTLVPIRVVTETLGGTVDWDDATKTVTLNIDGKEIKMTIGVILEKYGVAPTIINDRTYVPIRFVADELGAEVQWNEETKEVTIIKK